MNEIDKTSRKEKEKTNKSKALTNYTNEEEEVETFQQYSFQHFSNL